MNNPERDIDIGRLTMTEIVRLQNLLAQELSRRFEASAAVCFTDIADSTGYFSRFGDAAGRQLQQLHFDLLEQVLRAHEGRLVDTAGDGALSLFKGAREAADAMVELQGRVAEANQLRSREHQLTLRIGLHWGRVLTDGVQVTGDAVNLCSRIASSCEPGAMRLSRDLFLELSGAQRLQCRALGVVQLKGAGRGIELMLMDWRDRHRFPTAVTIVETGQRFDLPMRDIVSFGRLETIEGQSANDIVLALQDAQATRQISRWHFELRRRATGYMLRAVSDHPTQVDGQTVRLGGEVPVVPGSTVRLANVMTLALLSPRHPIGQTGDETLRLDTR